MINYFHKNWDKTVLFVLSLVLILPLLKPGYFSHHDDLHVIRIFEMQKCLKDFQIPCRWVPDMGYGYGFPLFNYYNPLPYYLGAVSSFFIGFINSAKLLFLLPLLFGGFSMYLFVKQVSNRASALLAGVLYAFAPYRSVDAYVRGAIGESFSLMFAPLIFYFSHKLAKEYSLGNFLGLSLSLAAFFMSHNVSIIIWGPVLSLWFLLLLTQNYFKNFKVLFLSAILGIGLSAFFTIPAFLEKSLISTEGLTSYALDFRNHFVSYKQLFFQKTWGYGASVFGNKDGLSFQIGFPHWILALVSFALFLFSFKKVEKEKRMILLFFMVVFVFAIYMTHVRSAWIWESFKELSFVQFPWRYLALAIFSTSVLGGLLLNFLSGKLAQTLLWGLIILTVFLNFTYFKPEKYVFDMTDEKKLNGIELQNQMQGSVLDYLPVTAKKPLHLAPKLPFSTKGNVSFENFEKESNSWSFKSLAVENSEITLPILEFPQWVIIDNGKEIEHSHDIDGYITLKITKGEHSIKGKFQNTPIRAFSNLLTLACFAFLLYLLTYGKNRKIFR